MRGFFLIVGCLFFWTYILKDSRFENKRDSTLEGSRYVSACLLSGPLIRRKRERSLFLSISPCYYVHCESCPFFPPIRTRSNMAGPPELRALLQRRDSFQKLLGLKFHPPLPFKKKKKKKKTQFQWIAKHLYLEFLWLKDLLSGENENGSIFSPYLKKQAPWCIFEGLRPCWLSYREAPYHSFSLGGRSRAGQSGLGF